MKSSWEEPLQEVAFCFQSHFLITISEFPTTEHGLGLLTVHLGLFAFPYVDSSVVGPLSWKWGVDWATKLICSVQ